MNQSEHFKKKNKKNSSVRVGDWICQFCSNYNYSFRAICNRCSVYRPSQNPYSFHEKVNQAYPSPPVIKKKESEQNRINDENFPKFLFLILGDEGSSRRDEEVGSKIRGNDHSFRQIHKLIDE